MLLFVLKPAAAAAASTNEKTQSTQTPINTQREGERERASSQLSSVLLLSNFKLLKDVRLTHGPTQLMQLENHVHFKLSHSFKLYNKQQCFSGVFRESRKSSLVNKRLILVYKGERLTQLSPCHQNHPSFFIYSNCFREFL